MDIRDLCERDMPAVLALIRADHLPGQPICTLQDVQNAVAGNATIDTPVQITTNSVVAFPEFILKK